MGKWIICKKCGHEYHSSLSKCPECGKATFTFKTALTILGSVLLIGGVAFGIISGFADNEPKKISVSSQESSLSEAKGNDSASSENTESIQKEDEKEPDVSNNSSTHSNSSKNETVFSAESSSSQVSQTQSTPELPIKPTIGTVLKDGKAYVTVSEKYLRDIYGILSQAFDMDFEEFAYSMSDEEKADGGLYIVKNSDGSATSVLTEKYYAELRVESQKQCKSTVNLLENYDFVERADHSNDFDGVIITLTVNSLSAEEQNLIKSAGLTFLYNQYLNPESNNKCKIELVFADKTKQVINFPSGN